MMLKRPMLLGAAIAVLFCSSASADATLTLDKPCYVATPTQSELVTLRAAGFTPTAWVDVFVDETFKAEPQVGYDTVASGTVPAPFIDAGERLFSVRVTEKSNPSISATATAKVTALSVTQTPRVAKTDRRVRFRGRGFTASRPVFAHYLFAGRDRKTVQVAYPSAPCGTFSVRRKQFPIKKPAVGPWTIQFDQEPTYNPGTMTKVTMSVQVKRTPKSRAR